MRILLFVGVLTLLVSSLSLAGSQTPGGGVTVLPVPADGGFCWGEGVIPGVPPDGGFCWGEGVIPGVPPDTSVTVVVDGRPGVTGGGGMEMLSGGARQGGTPAAAKQADASHTARRGQMYIPAAVWRWVAEHPVRTK